MPAAQVSFPKFLMCAVLIPDAKKLDTNRDAIKVCERVNAVWRRPIAIAKRAIANVKTLLHLGS